MSGAGQRSDKVSGQATLLALWKGGGDAVGHSVASRKRIRDAASFKSSSSSNTAVAPLFQVKRKAALPQWENSSLLNAPMLLLRSTIGGTKSSQRNATRETLASLSDWDDNVTFTAFGKQCKMRRRICQYSTGGAISYSYSGLKDVVAPEFPRALYDIKCQVEDLLLDHITNGLDTDGGTANLKKNRTIAPEFVNLLKTINNEKKNGQRRTEIFNYCLLNHYRSGEEYMSYHTDDESSLDPHSPIASVSLGVARNFDIRQRKMKGSDGRRPRLARISLGDGDLLLMFPPMQDHYEHAVPIEKRVVGDRINLTFRRIVTK